MAALKANLLTHWGNFGQFCLICCIVLFSMSLNNSSLHFSHAVFYHLGSVCLFKNTSFFGHVIQHELFHCFWRIFASLSLLKKGQIARRMSAMHTRIMAHNMWKCEHKVWAQSFCMLLTIFNVYRHNPFLKINHFLTSCLWPLLISPKEEPCSPAVF